MEAEITLHIGSTDPEAPLQEFIDALEILLTWQWDNVMITSVLKDED